MSHYGAKAEQQAFRHHSATLLCAVDSPDQLAWQLFSAGLISSPVRDQALVPMLSAMQKNGILLSAVESKIKVEPAVFHRFVELLQRTGNSTLAAMGMKMKAACGKW